MTPYGETAIMDGVYAALTATLAQTGRSLVVVCTDGYDTASWLQPDEVIESAKRSNAVIYAVTSADARARLAPERSDGRDRRTDAGGRVERGISTGAFQRILRDFRSRYVLAYTPRGVSAEGFHRLDVRVKRRGLTVRARPVTSETGPAR